MKDCNVCGCECDDNGECPVCKKAEFAVFAKKMGLTRYPDPTGERYVYNLDGSCDGKKSECTDFIDELWNALARAKKGPQLED